MVEKAARELIEETLQSPLATVTDDALAVGFDVHHLDALFAVLNGLDTPPRVRVLATDAVLNSLRKRFFVASMAAELVENDVVVLRTPVSGELLEHNLLLTGEQALAVLAAGESAGVLADDDEVFAGALTEHFERDFETSEPFDLRMPGRTRISETLIEGFGSDVEATFWKLVRDQTATDGYEENGIVFEPVRAALLAAAIHEETLYDIARWGENVGIASRASFSRVKSQLVDDGLIDTEKAPIEVGRPRQRLIKTE